MKHETQRTELTKNLIPGLSVSANRSGDARYTVEEISSIDNGFFSLTVSTSTGRKIELKYGAGDAWTVYDSDDSLDDLIDDHGKWNHGKERNLDRELGPMEDEPHTSTDQGGSANQSTIDKWYNRFKHLLNPSELKAAISKEIVDENRMHCFVCDEECDGDYCSERCERVDRRRIDDNIHYGDDNPYL